MPGRQQFCRLRAKVRREYRKYATPLVCGALLIICVLSLSYVSPGETCNSVQHPLHHGSARHLLQVDSASTPAPTANYSVNTTVDPCVAQKGFCSDDCNSAEYPPDLFTCEQKNKGAIVLHFVGLIYMFIALALVCDEFFVPSLAVIIEKLQISEDVAGATFMAAGGSAPELATSFIGTFVAKSNVGIGTIVGSAVFNILFVISMCAFFSKSVLQLTWWPLFRDICFYTISLIVLILAFRNNSIAIWESVILFVCYLVYVIFMKWNAQVEVFVKSRLCPVQPKTTNNAEEEEEEEEVPPVPVRRPSVNVLRSTTGRFRRSAFQLMTNGPETRLARNPRMAAVVTDVMSLVRHQKNGNAAATDGEAKGTPTIQVPPAQGNDTDGAEATGSPSVSPNSPENDMAILSKLSKRPFALRSQTAAAAEPLLQDGEAAKPKDEDEHKDNLHAPTAVEVRVEDGTGSQKDAHEEEDVDEPLDMTWPVTTRERVTYIICAPIMFPLWITLPDPRRPERKKFFAWTFLGSIIWIGAFSFLMAWWAKLIGEIMRVPEAIMGLTFLAAGTSIPDLLTSVIVAKKGFGDMAVSSSIGSNLFDITVGLPIPWFFWSATHQIQEVNVTSKGMFCSILLLFGMLMTVVISIAGFRWKMTKGLGAAMMCLYGVFITISILMEYNIVPCVFK